MKLAYCTVCKESKISSNEVAEDSICRRCSSNYVDNEGNFLVTVWIMSWILIVGMGNKGHCLNLQTDLGRRLEIFSVLPHLPEKFPTYVIRVLHENSNSSGKLFKVNLHNCLQWLCWLKENNPNNHDVVIDYDHHNVLLGLANSFRVLDLADLLPGVVELSNGNTVSAEEKKDDDIESEIKFCK